METIGSVDDNNPPDIFEFKGTWDSYEEELYEIFDPEKLSSLHR